ncbi:hypothetical protein JRO89_XS01G0157100 [Xanthoceras sorbifolium]|uniref:non-specific serine/threonine protein kinase n=1 Tax=Xanthoceras sorbifolium TaxID=99658 RepID=A0ABQ8IKY8_9ROSI|nr:hypothetical protein JRO89_XS01G0157100 [Xanthoceras sorbifolium]
MERYIYLTRLDKSAPWKLTWWEPNDRCNVFRACGDFASCSNRKNESRCKYLPGFESVSTDHWNAEEFSEGCRRKMPLCRNKKKAVNFLPLNVIKVGKPDGYFENNNENECKEAWRLWQEDKEDPDDRPAMSDIITVLSSVSATLSTTKRPAFIGNGKEVSLSISQHFVLAVAAIFPMRIRGDLIRDNEGETLVSPGKIFELGFFTPNGSSDHRRYVGIWYYGSQTVVWVANRDSPVLDDSGVFGTTEDKNLKVLDGNGRTYWSTDLGNSSSANRTVKLMDSGNLVVSEEDQENHSARTLWQSFDNPTDTFLPGMKMNDLMVLSSWRSYDDPAPGNFTFQLDQEEVNQYVIWNRSMKYWKSGVSGKFIGSDEMPSAMSYLLSNFTSSVHNGTVPYLTSSLYGDTRMIMSFWGQARYFQWNSIKVWSLIWAEPRDRCSLYNACGNFGSCNSNNKLMCKCLPGFEPSLPQNWNRGDFSGGCTRKSKICGKNAESDTFLSLNMMNVGNPDSQFNAKNEAECKLECLNNCQCQAYSYQKAQITQSGVTGASACWIWSEDINNLQEEYQGGGSLFVRVAGSDIGQVSFEAPGGTYRVTRINPETQKIFIQTNNEDNCEGGNLRDNFLKLNRSSPFHVTGCDADSLTGRVEVDISWDRAPEPTCSSSEDCKSWPNSSCNKTGDGKTRCLCNRGFQWNSLSLHCTEGENAIISKKMVRRAAALSELLKAIGGNNKKGKVSLSLIIALASTRNRGNIQRNLARHLCDSERHVKDLIDSGRFKEDDGKGIDAWQLWKEDKALNLLDQTISESRDANEVLKCVNVGLLCVQEDPSDRPTMSNVVFMLGSDTATLPTPKQPAFVVRRCASSRASSCSKPETFSNNELTVTLEDGR